jgi:hypothetical protein
MNERAVAAALAFLVVGCRPQVDLGLDGELQAPTECMSVAPTVACPDSSAWGRPTTFVSLEQLREQLRGQWAFCGGLRRYTGRGALAGFYGGAGVEFWEDAGVLRYSFLEGTGPYTRISGGFHEGTVQLELTTEGPRARLLATDGLEAPWQLQLFDGQRVLRNVAFETWDFVSVTRP